MKPNIWFSKCIWNWKGEAFSTLKRYF